MFLKKIDLDYKVYYISNYADKPKTENERSYDGFK